MRARPTRTSAPAVGAPAGIHRSSVSQVPVHAIKKLKKLLRISLGHENNMNAWKQSPNFMKYMTAHGLAEPRNADLSISAEGVEELKEALPQVLNFKTWPAIIREREEL